MMSLEKVTLQGLSAADVARALRAATAVPELTITAAPELNGAVVRACCVAVYVMVDAQATGISLDCWHACSTSPYKVVRTTRLEDAVRLAMAEFDNLEDC